MAASFDQMSGRSGLGDRYREEVLGVRLMRLNVGRARIVTQLAGLLSFVSSSVEMERAGKDARAACCDLFSALRQDDCLSLRETNLVWSGGSAH
jgi:hypothetical protein